MPGLRGKDLSKLYPQPKSFDDLKAERERSQRHRRPKFVSVKISVWATLWIVTVLVAYWTISGIITSSLASEGGVISGVSFSALLAMSAVAVLFYVYSLIEALASRVMLSTAVLYAALASTMIAAGILLQYLGRNLLMTAAILLVHFLATYFTVNVIIKYQE